MQTQNLSMDQLVGFIVNENKKVSSKHGLSQSLSHYYDCISGWNPVWFQNKSKFESKLTNLHKKNRDFNQRQADSVLELGKCLTYKLSQLSFKTHPELYQEDLNEINLKERIYRK